MENYLHTVDKTVGKKIKCMGPDICLEYIYLFISLVHYFQQCIFFSKVYFEKISKYTFADFRKKLNVN